MRVQVADMHYTITICSNSANNDAFYNMNDAQISEQSIIASPTFVGWLRIRLIFRWFGWILISFAFMWVAIVGRFWLFVRTHPVGDCLSISTSITPTSQAYCHGCPKYKHLLPLVTARRPAHITTPHDDAAWDVEMIAGGLEHDGLTNTHTHTHTHTHCNNM